MAEQRDYGKRSQEDRQRANNAPPKDKEPDEAKRELAASVPLNSGPTGYSVNGNTPPEIPQNTHPSRHPAGGSGNDSKPK